LGFKHPIQYELKPDRVEKGVSWVELTLENLGSEPLKNLEIGLNSLDSRGLKVDMPVKWLGSLKPHESRSISYRVHARRTTKAYITLYAYTDGERFTWESPSFQLYVEKEAAELLGLFILSHPHTSIGKTFEAEAVLHGLGDGEELTLEFLATTPEGGVEELGRMKIMPLEKGEKASYSVEITPDLEGVYTIYAYLYHEGGLLGRERDKIYVEREMVTE
jgi:hypothetical protein